MAPRHRPPLGIQQCKLANLPFRTMIVRRFLSKLGAFFLTIWICSRGTASGFLRAAKGGRRCASAVSDRATSFGARGALRIVVRVSDSCLTLMRHWVTTSNNFTRVARRSRAHVIGNPIATRYIVRAIRVSSEFTIIWATAAGGDRAVTESSQTTLNWSGTNANSIVGTAVPRIRT